MVPDRLRATFRLLVTGGAPWPLFLYGGVGVGKSCAVLALTDFIPGAVYLTAAEFVSRHTAAITGRGEKINWDRMTGKNCPLVVLDELGAREKVSDTGYEAIIRLLDARDNWPLVVVSNLDGDGIARIYDARIASRIMAGSQFELRGEDRRIA